MTDLFRGLAEMDSALTEEGKVVYLLASLPESYGVLVTALEASTDVPKMDVVTERLLHEDRNMLSWEKESTPKEEQAMVTRKSRSPRKKVRCYTCSRLGYCKRDCPEMVDKAEFPKADGVGLKARVSTGSELEDEGEALIAGSCWWYVC